MFDSCYSKDTGFFLFVLKGLCSKSTGSLESRKEGSVPRGYFVGTPYLHAKRSPNGPPRCGVSSKLCRYLHHLLLVVVSSEPLTS